MTHESYADSLLAAILRETKTIALVGASADPSRPSHRVLDFLIRRGYRLFPVNPHLAAEGASLFGARVYAKLADVSEPVDMVDVFRNSAAAGATVDEALALDPLPKVIWMQLGVRNDAAAAAAEARGVTVIMNRCPAIEYRRLLA